MLDIIIFAAILFQSFINCVPTVPSTESLVFFDETASTQPKERLPPVLKSMHVTSSIRNRYARTKVETKYLNPDNYAQEATFTITLPDTAYISGFIMEIDGKRYEAYVREKEEAKKEYQEAVRQGQTAGHVEMNARDSEVFTVSVNVEPLSKVLFTLTYEQLLQRKHGKYEMVLNLHPRQLVDDFSVDVIINETRRITNVDTFALRSGNEIVDSKKVAKNDFATTNLNDDQTEVNIHFAPSKQQQEEIMARSKQDKSKGISGQFVIEYDVERNPQGGEVIFDDGYFVHFFAPSALKRIPKHIVFVLDVSGSMSGRKMKQLIEAMQVILEELNQDDYFHLLKFSTQVQIWDEDWYNIDRPLEFENPQPLSMNEQNIAKVQEVVREMNVEGGTNIYDALLIALRLTYEGVNHNNEVKKIQPIIFFLTDGQANEGIYDYNEILKMVHNKNKNENRAAIFALSFGKYANEDFLKNLASRNSGFMRTIYEAADASLQLQDFYKTISSPLLTNINFVYADQASNLTKSKFSVFFNGSELVVAGKLTNHSENFVSVQANTSNGIHCFIPSVFSNRKPEMKKKFGSLERLWAYMSIRQLLNKKYESNDGQNSTAEEEALNIALKYSFVTPVSSLVVVKPNSTEAQSTKPANDKMHSPDVRPGRWGRTRARTRARTKSSLMVGLPISRLHQFNISQAQDLTISFLTGEQEIIFDKKKYLIGDNSTTFEYKPCQVDSLQLNGTCTLLSTCPKIYPVLDTIEMYKKYFCALKSERYAGVCCVDVDDDDDD